FKSSALLSQIDEHLKTQTAALRKEQASKNSDGKVATWTFDLKSGEGVMHKGTVTGLKPDIAIDVMDENSVALSESKANGQRLFMPDKIKVKDAIIACYQPELGPQGRAGEHWLQCEVVNKTKKKLWIGHRKY
ncbi:hypothetical protein BGZ93_004748, partial [Podila epicladia]